MSTDEIKIPLNIRKFIKDSEDKVNAALKKCEEFVGSPIEFVDNAESNYSVLTDAKEKEGFGKARLTYLEKTVHGLEGLYKDSTAKEYFNKCWTSKKIVWTVLPEAEFEARKKLDRGGDKQNGMWINEKGDVEIYTHPAGFFHKTADIPQTAYWKKAPPILEGELPMDIKMDYHKMLTKVDEHMKKLHALEGLSDAEFVYDPLATYKAVVLDHKSDEKEKDFNIARAEDYLAKLSNYIEKTLWKDSLVRDGVLAHWKAPHKIIICPEVDIAAATGAVAKAPKNNCAIRLENGDFQILIGKGKWGVSVSDMTSLNITKVI